MKTLSKIIILTVFVIVASNYKSLAAPITNGKDNDTASLKSNIVIFKFFAAPTVAPSSATKSKSLKKAGSMARTSNNLHTNILITKPVPNQG